MKIFYILALAVAAITHTIPAEARNVDMSVMERIYDETDILPAIRHASEEEQDELVCLSLNVYHETRSSTIDDMMGSVFVALKRIKEQHRGKNTACEVVWDTKQFSWTHDGASDIPREEQAWEMSQMIAVLVYFYADEGLPDPTNGANHYVRYDVVDDVEWTKKAEWYLRVGDHVYMYIES